MAEALLVGVIASVVGIFAGLGVAKLIALLFDAIGFGLPVGSLSLGGGTIIVAMVIGIGVTLIASFVPALRSTKIPPVAAIREGAQLPPGWLARKGRSSRRSSPCSASWSSPSACSSPTARRRCSSRSVPARCCCCSASR